MLSSMLKSRWTRRAVLVAGGLAILGLWGCGKTLTGFDDPNATITTTLTPNALIEAATLKQWMDEGKVNNPDASTRDRVVILDVATPTQYATNHIPGALLMNASTELNMTRLEGLAAISTMVPDGPSMDAVIQRSCIDEHTTIVLTAAAGQNYLNAARAYFHFRYWGFPKERLKILQSGEDGWTAAGHSLTTVVPSVNRSTFSVSENYLRNPEAQVVRASIGQMIDIVDRINAGALSTSSATGIRILDTRGGVDPLVGPYMANATVDDWNEYHVAGQAGTFKPTDQLIARLAAVGVTSSKSMTYVYCASGVRCASVFFVLDGILGWPVTMYDGSMNQWLGYRTANNVATAWRIDVTSPNTTLLRTFGTPAGTIVLDPTANATYSSVLDRRANQIGVEDQSYFRNVSTGGRGPGDGGGGGSPSGC